MASRVTVGDIANRAGVSTATVSRVLNVPERVKGSTRDGVYAAMRELNYVPPAARRDPETLTQIIGIFATNLLLDSVTEFVRAVESELRDTTFNILLVNMHGNHNFGEFIIDNSHILKKIDGAVVFSADVSDRAVEFMRGADVPMVLVQARSSQVHSISNNNFLGGQDAAGHLVACGYRRIAFVGWKPVDDHVSDRLAGFWSTLVRAGRQLGESLIAYGSLDVSGGYEATRTLLARSEPDAIFYASDVLAVGGLRLLQERNRAVPDEIAVMGFDDLSIAAPLGLTTMRQFFASKAHMIVEYLVGRINGAIREERAEEIQISPRLVVRQTTCNATREPIDPAKTAAPLVRQEDNSKEDFS